jgi:hypothetical protein
MVGEVLGGAFLISCDSLQKPFLSRVKFGKLGTFYGDIDVTINVTNNVTIISVGFDLCGDGGEPARSPLGRPS